MIKYCIHCQKEVFVQEVENEYHAYGRDGGWGWIECFGPFATSCPPEMSEEYWESILAKDYTVSEDDLIYSDNPNDNEGDK